MLLLQLKKLKKPPKKVALLINEMSFLFEQ